MGHIHIYKHQKRVPKEWLLSNVSRLINEVKECHCGKLALSLVSNGRSFDGFCAEHREEAEEAGRKRMRISSANRERSRDRRHAFSESGKLTDLSKPKKGPFKRVSLSNK